VHAAAALPDSFDNSDHVGARNRAIDDQVLLFARRWHVPVVYVSTVALYPQSAGVPLDESTEIAPIGGYLTEKARTEQLGLDQAEVTGVPFTVLRICAPYGPGQARRTVIQHFVERAKAGESLEYYGTGSREQDFTWADDVGDAVALALSGRGGIFNVATGRPITMRALAEAVAGAAELPSGLVRPAGRVDPQEGAKARFDVTAAARELRWTAATTVEIGIARLLEEQP
jgi:UDP-glucose 4-epimerase